MSRVNKTHTNQALDTSVVLIFLCGFVASDGIAAARARLEGKGQITRGGGAFVMDRRMEIKPRWGPGDMFQSDRGSSLDKSQE